MFLPGLLASLTLIITSPSATAARPLVTVAKQGIADFRTVQAAIDGAPPQGETILLAPGLYAEKLSVQTANIHLIGKGAAPGDVVLHWNDSAAGAGGTGKSGSVTVSADGFEAENLTIENTWEQEHGRAEQGSQAVALLLSSDRAVLDHVRLLGAQDTLYANSRTCRDPESSAPCGASRELFNDCFIEGHVDFIFGDAKAVFQNCELHTLHHATVMLTAQSKHFSAEDSGYYFLGCRITGTDAGEQVYLGRPWRDYSTVLFYKTEIDRPLNPAGWLEWNDRLKTSTYREYKSHGPAFHSVQPVVPQPLLSSVEERGLTVQDLLAGADQWDANSALRSLRQEAKESTF